MVFNSLDFVLFAIVFFALWPWMSKRPNVRWAFLVVASFVFYGWWDWRFLFLLIVSGLIDFGAALAMHRWPAARTALLVVSMAGNLSILGLFKYGRFITENINTVSSAFFDTAPLDALNLALPIGISFYTFQSMSYTIDVYRGQLRPVANPLHFFAYLALFPQLVAGPIVRAADLLPQLLGPPVTTEESRWQGTQLIVWGLFKKVVVADSVAVAVNRAYMYEQPPGSAAYWWIITAMFAVQIYCDFSGYTLIARGLGKWMGCEFTENFRNPYAATSLRDFWGRWHMSLSTWFRDYVYVPLGGSKGSVARSHLNLWITMLLSGLWHGASWTYVVWGAWHAAWVSIERLTRWPERLRKLPVLRHLAPGVVFVLVLLGWVFFRATSIAQAGRILQRMMNPASIDLSFALGHVGGKALLLTALILLAEFAAYLRVSGAVARWPRVPRLEALHPLFIGALFAACVYLRGPDNVFIYFQF